MSYSPNAQKPFKTWFKPKLIRSIWGYDAESVPQGEFVMPLAMQSMPWVKTTYTSAVNSYRSIDTYGFKYDTSQAVAVINSLSVPKVTSGYFQFTIKSQWRYIFSGAIDLEKSLSNPYTVSGAKVPSVIPETVEDDPSDYEDELESLSGA